MRFWEHRRAGIVSLVRGFSALAASAGDDRAPSTSGRPYQAPRGRLVAGLVGGQVDLLERAGAFPPRDFRRSLSEADETGQVTGLSTRPVWVPEAAESDRRAR